MTPFEAFQRRKIERLIITKGKSFMFKRNALNDYDEPTGDVSNIACIQAVYHEATHSYLKETDSEQSRYTKEIESMLLCLRNEVADSLRIDDFVFINKKKYKIIKKKDINNLGIAWDISLEFIDDGHDA